MAKLELLTLRLRRTAAGLPGRLMVADSACPPDHCLTQGTLPVPTVPLRQFPDSASTRHECFGHGLEEDARLDDGICGGVSRLVYKQRSCWEGLHVARGRACLAAPQPLWSLAEGIWDGGLSSCVRSEGASGMLSSLAGRGQGMDSGWGCGLEGCESGDELRSSGRSSVLCMVSARADSPQQDCWNWLLFSTEGVGIAESVGGKEVRIPFAGTGVCALCCVVLTCFFCSCNPKASLCPLRGGCPGRLSGVLEWRCREGGDLDAQPSADLLGTLTYRLVWPLVVVVCV